MKILRRILLIFFGIVVIYFSAMLFRKNSVVSNAEQLKTEHFRITFRGIHAHDAKSVADQLEANYSRIRKELKDPQHAAIEVFIHGTQSDFNSATGLVNSTANGTSRGPNAFHILWTNWFNSLFPDNPEQVAVHEFTHCIQLNILIEQFRQQYPDLKPDEFNKNFEEKFSQSYPRWFWESLCDYEAGISNRFSINYGMNKGLTIEQLNDSNQIYNIGYTIIEYIVDKWGKEKLPELITSYGDVEKVLGVSREEFQQGWEDFVELKY